jgi:MFS family permease
MAGQSLAPLAPFLLNDLASSRTELGLMVSIFLVGGGVGSTPGGWLADRSMRWTLLGGQVFPGLMILVFTRMPSFQTSLLPLFLAGLGFGAIISTVARAVASWFPVRERATALGVSAGGYFGPFRAAISGKKVSPPLFESMQALGRDEVLRRVARGTAELRKLG